MFFIELILPNVHQIDVTDFRMRHDITNGPSVLSMFKNHYHRSFEIYYLVSGERYYFIKDKTFHVKSGDIVLINSYDLHRTSLVNNDTSERILICITEDFISSIVKSYAGLDLFACFKKDDPVLRFDENYSKLLQNQLYKMLDIYMKSSHPLKGSSELYMKALSIELLLLLNNFSNSKRSHVFEHPSNIHKKISDAAVFINNNYMENITLNSLCSHLNISKYYFVRLFKEITGLTFIDYLNIIRLKNAQTLLCETDYTISAVSHEIGFCDASYFCRVFKKYCSCTPASYRKQHFKEKNN